MPRPHINTITKCQSSFSNRHRRRHRALLCRRCPVNKFAPPPPRQQQVENKPHGWRKDGLRSAPNETLTQCHTAFHLAYQKDTVNGSESTVNGAWFGVRPLSRGKWGALHRSPMGKYDHNGTTGAPQWLDLDHDSAAHVTTVTSRYDRHE